MGGGAVPVPVWNCMMRCWEPVDFRNGQRVVGWPEGFDPSVLPIPEYQDGDRVQFVRDETCAREGVVRCVLFQGDLRDVKGPQVGASPLRSSAADPITYIVTARGHDHRLKAWNILGRFVTLERVSRVLPLPE